MKLNYKKILEILKQKTNVYDFATENGGIDDLSELGEIKEVAKYGGIDQGSAWYSIKYFKDHNVYIKVSGCYSSYDGIDFYGEWNCCKEVKPKTKKIIVYE